jgi:hypothetical protein
LQRDGRILLPAIDLQWAIDIIKVSCVFRDSGIDGDLMNFPIAYIAASV